MIERKCETVKQYGQPRDLLRPVVNTMPAAPLAGLPGIYRELRRRKYYKGPHQPRPGDLADTELAIYGM